MYGATVVFTNAGTTQAATIQSFAPDRVVVLSPGGFGSPDTAFIEVRNPDGSVARSATFYTYT